MKLKDYKPMRECIVKDTLITRAKFPVFDFHTHMGKLLLGPNYLERYDTKDFMEVLKKKNVHGIVNLDGFWGTDVDEMLGKVGSSINDIHTFIWIDTMLIDTESFHESVIHHIEESVDKGIKGIKIWKDVSLYQKDINGMPIRVDDPRLDIVYEMAAKYSLPVLIHIADPTAFFKELNETNERYEEISENPSWSFYGPDYMSFEELLIMQENMISKHPNTNFVVAHVGSYAENLLYVSEQLDKYPNLYVDISARIAELGRVPYSARKFFMDYSDRILFGTDCTPISVDSLYETTFRFLETNDEYFSYSGSDVPGQGRWNIYGIYLPDEVLKNVYYRNALRLLNIDENEWLHSIK